MPPLDAGQVLLRVDRFGLTTNNVTYGVVGDVIGYWDFFPAAEGWGRIPVWGFAEVVAGEVAGLTPATRVFGYFPMASHLVVEPTRVGPHGFADGARHRVQLPAVYNRYQRTDADPLYRTETEDVHAVFVPLFVTSFVLDDFLADNADFGAERVVLSSASSKTSAGTALCSSRRAGARPLVVGLTSAAHVGFVEGLGCYDQVVTYDDLTSLDASVTTVFVDIAGNANVRLAVHRHLGDRLAASLTVGMTHRESLTAHAELPGPEPTFFFAPSQIDKRVAEWGQAGYQQRLVAAWSGLLEVVHRWVDIVEINGFDALAATYRQMLDGATRPDQAFVVNVAAELS